MEVRVDVTVGLGSGLVAIATGVEGGDNDLQKRFIKTKGIAHAHSHSHTHGLTSGVQPEGIGGIGRCAIVDMWHGVVAGHCIVSSWCNRWVQFEI